ncbi:hypothetical protein FACS189467_1630 [Bacteroidia bacterium]|nr:hypothetical protein FACS189467_1630 [Bacteroidia bacterium]
MKQPINVSDIKKQYPDEWILLGNPVRDKNGLDVLSGVLVYHSPDKKEVCYLGKPLIKGFDKTYMFFNRITPRKTNRVWLFPFRRVGTIKPINQ